MTPWRLRACAILAMAAALSGCSRSSTTPVSPFGPSTAIVGLKISGPSTIAPGSTAQFSAVATHFNGSSEDVTATVQWRSSDTSILTISATGLTSGIHPGEVSVTATQNAFGTVTQRIVVTPTGTFRLDGRVSWLGRAVEGASVQVTAGTGAGLTTLTDFAGSYRLYGVAGNVELTVSKALYALNRQTASIAGNTTLNFEMVTAAPAPNLAGTYTLQITADPGCATGGPQTLPDSGRVRRYTATIEGSANLNVRLSGANFLPQQNLMLGQKNLMFGYVTPDGAMLDVNHLDYYYGIGYPPPDLGEILPDGDVYCPSGSITVSAIGANLVGALDGTIRVRGLPSGDVVGQCTSAHHTVMFTRQNSNSSSIRARR
jgi:hypothetical protein